MNMTEWVYTKVVPTVHFCGSATIQMSKNSMEKKRAICVAFSQLWVYSMTAFLIAFPHFQRITCNIFKIIFSPLCRIIKGYYILFYTYVYELMWLVPISSWSIQVSSGLQRTCNIFTSLVLDLSTRNIRMNFQEEKWEQNQNNMEKEGVAGKLKQTSHWDTNAVKCNERVNFPLLDFLSFGLANIWEKSRTAGGKSHEFTFFSCFICRWLNMYGI